MVPSLKRHVALCLLVAYGIIAMLMADASAFIGARAKMVQVITREPNTGLDKQNPCMAKGCADPSRHNGGPASSLCILPAAACVSIWLRATNVKHRPSVQALRRYRHTCYFFGGGGKEKAKQEELSAAAKEACEKLEMEISELKAHAEDKRMAHERLKLEVDNFRTRTRQELAAARGKAAVPLIKELLPIADEFELAKKNLKIEGEDEQAVADRFSVLFSKMLDTWKGLGVTKLQSVGEPFNPELHEAVTMIPSAEYGPEVVCNELRAGWVLKTAGSDAAQVLRPSLVCVSSGPGPS